MTTYLLNYYLLFVKKMNRWVVVFIIGFFFFVEASFFIANVAKIKERWMFLFFELFIFSIMYIWFFARKKMNRLVKFVEIGKFTQTLTELSMDNSIPKFATHLIYLTKADNRHHVEDKIINSILSKKPKRADVYWFLHIDRTNEPYTMEYNINELVNDKVIKVNIKLGFRIQPRTELYFKKIVKDLVSDKELNLHIIPDGSTIQQRT
jgi:KUP system potassium uptake protein